MLIVMAEMFRSSGRVHRAALLLPVLVIAVIAALSIATHMAEVFCARIHVLQYWIAALSGVVAMLMFQVWQRHEFLRVAERLIAAGKLVVTAAEPPDSGIMISVTGQPVRAISSGLPRFAFFASLAFQFLMAFAAGSMGRHMCTPGLQTHELLERIPAGLVALFMCTFFVLMSWLFQWTGESAAIGERIVAQHRARVG